MPNEVVESSAHAGSILQLNFRSKPNTAEDALSCYCHQTMDNNNSPSGPFVTARKRYVHLYMPLITAILLFTYGSFIAHVSGGSSMNSPAQLTMLRVAASAFPTYYVASHIYPANRPDPTPEEMIRFTRKHSAYRAFVLFTACIFSTTFNLRYFIADFALSYLMGAAIGERPVGTRQRRSQFLVALYWIAGSCLITSLTAATIPALLLWVRAGDRMVRKAAYLALVDDVIAILSRPNARTVRGKCTLILVQAFTIMALLWFIFASLGKLAGSGTIPEW
jgi:hypothetical protein